MADGTALRPAEDVARTNKARQRNESPEYRAAREALLVEEIKLNRQIARVAALRRGLPPGGEVTGDYRFLGEASSVQGAEPVGIEALFGDKDTLFLYNWMYGPRRARPCPMCTALLSCLNGNADHIRQRIAMAVVALSPIERQVAFKVERGWTNLPMYADVNGDFSRDYHAVMEDGTDTAAIHVFTRRDGTVRHFWSAELGFESADPGKDPTTEPDLMVLWNVLDLTPDGRGTDWYPSITY
ncbi:MAG: DUF899 family protein [Phenylobacterium sp.]|uniref:DUF899 family protein n=1 Tax=Phenylobacterium sp. TaxID=1871053 RepID=UPI001A55C02F|nr:DUF899 family protein [Phenylobacterium sp.]MBL8556981.1 DUF899 family protein [Phenylobacterium sp.]